MAAIMAIVQAIYALQAFVDPAGFAAYRGTPITDAAGTMWVHTYGSRTLFVALVVALLLIREELATLKWVALIGIVMPISDALVAIRAEAPLAIVLRHVATGLYLLITFIVIQRSSDRVTSPEKAASTS
jgi:heme A synthase